MKRELSKDLKKDSLMSLFEEELLDMLDAEEQIVQALPNMIKSADSPELKDAFTTHLEETKNQVRRLEEICNMINLREKGETCEAMVGLIRECKRVINDFPKSFVRDAALISKAQRIEHYEISAYGTLKTFAKLLDIDDAIDLLEDNQEEEVNADELLTQIAEGSLLTTGINQKASRGSRNQYY